jgi:hypothetical protein
VSDEFPPRRVTMTNIRLRIEDAIPAVGFGSVGTAHFSGTTTGSREPSTTPVAYRMAPVAYRMAPVSPAKVETI